jgi:hypothetical protein
MILKKQLLFVFCLLTYVNVFGQAEKDSILLLNGKVYRGTITGMSDGFLKFNEIDKKGNMFTSQIEDYRIFSYTQKGQESIVYQMDEFKNNFLTVEEAKNVTLGSYDARKRFKPRFVFWSSFALSYAASIFDTYLPQHVIDNPDYLGGQTSPGLFKANATMIPFLIVPPVLTIGWAFPSFRIKEKQMIQMHLVNNESYYHGFHRIAKQKRILAALKGSLIGIGSGLITYAIFKP